MYDLGSKYLYTHDGSLSTLNLNLFKICQCLELVTSVTYMVLRVIYFDECRDFVITDRITDE